MIPSSRQWMPLSDNILVYPLTRYAIIGNKRTHTTTADEYFRRIRLLHKKFTTGRRYRSVKYYVRRNGRNIVTGHRDHADSNSVSDSDNDSHRSASILTASTVTSSSSTGRSRSSSRSVYGRGNRRHRRRRRRSCHKSSSDDHENHDLRADHAQRPRNSMLYVDNNTDNEIVPPLLDSGRGITTTAANSPFVRDVVTRCSANVVLLAHGNRSLHVLTIQRSQQTLIAHHRNTIHTVPVSAASYCTAVVVRYKLPGGQLILTNDEQKNYKQEDRNTCTCPDDYRWYAAALEHFMKKTPISAVIRSSIGPVLLQKAEGIDDQQIVLLGNWYRTQDKGTRCRADYGYNPQDHNHHNPQCYYYPYKPAHISHQTIEHKRVYAVPDVQKLYGSSQILRLRTPRDKIKTLTGPDGTVTTRTTTYKCKFVPLSRMYENNRLYGPILSSLPVVLSGMNLIYLP